eukprot:scaffold2156_cov115-Cylindrotheca_fusiformis.AAC.15
MQKGTKSRPIFRRFCSIGKPAAVMFDIDAILKPVSFWPHAEPPMNCSFPTIHCSDQKFGIPTPSFSHWQQPVAAIRRSLRTEAPSSRPFSG